jgi:hypothetical protein
MKTVLCVQTLLVAAILLSGCGKSENRHERWTVQQANEWASRTGWLRGSNFTPSTAINQLEFWQAETFDPSTIDRELGYAESIGFNVMRVFLHHKAWLQDREGFKNRMAQYLAIADKHKIKTMFVFFDDCWNGTSNIGKQPEPKVGIHNSGWLQDPGQKESSDTTMFPELERYVKDVMNHFADDTRIALWDLYNEPGNSGKGDSSLNLLRHAFEWARATSATQPLTSGVWMDSTSRITQRQIELSDVISFHNYSGDTLMQNAVNGLKKYERPIVCSEYMARKFGSTFKDILPLLRKENIGAINWGLVKGKTNTIYAWGDTTHADGSEPELWFHDIFRPDGSPFSQEEVEVIKRECLNR